MLYHQLLLIFNHLAKVRFHLEFKGKPRKAEGCEKVEVDAGSPRYRGLKKWSLKIYGNFSLFEDAGAQNFCQGKPGAKLKIHEREIPEWFKNEYFRGLSS